MKRYLDHADIVRRYQAGEGIRAIARAHRCGHSTVYHVLHHAGARAATDGRTRNARDNGLARDRYLIRAGVMP